MVVPPKAKKRKVAIAYNRNDPDKEKEKTQKKTTFESDDAIPESVSKLNKTVSYDDSDSSKFVGYAFLFVPKLDLVFILYFLFTHNYLQMLTPDWIFLPSKQIIPME